MMYASQKQLSHKTNDLMYWKTWLLLGALIFCNLHQRTIGSHPAVWLAQMTFIEVHGFCKFLSASDIKSPISADVLQYSTFSISGITYTLMWLWDMECIINTLNLFCQRTSKHFTNSYKWKPYHPLRKPSLITKYRYPHFCRWPNHDTEWLNDLVKVTHVQSLGQLWIQPKISALNYIHKTILPPSVNMHDGPFKSTQCWPKSAPTDETTIDFSGRNLANAEHFQMCCGWIFEIETFQSNNNVLHWYKELPFWGSWWIVRKPDVTGSSSNYIFLKI